MHTRYLFFTVLFTLFFLTGKAQSIDEHEAFAKETVAYLGDTLYHVGVEPIRLPLWKDLIKAQPITTAEKEQTLLRVNSNYMYWYKGFIGKMRSLRTEYQMYASEGAELSFYDYEVKEIPNRLKMHQYRVRFVLNHNGLQNIVSLTFKTGYVLDKLVLMSPMEEEF